MAKKKSYRFFLYLLSRLGAALICALPRSWALRLGRMGARLAFGIIERQRAKALKNLEYAFGHEKSREEINAIAREVFENLAVTAVEMIQFPKLNHQKIDKLVDTKDTRKVYQDLLGHGRGLISMTAHLGNWELLAGVVKMLGFSGAVVARRIYYEPYNRWIVNLRGSLKVPTLYRDQSSKDILKILARNETVGLLPDQDIDSLKGIFVPFFGRLAYTSTAPVRLALGAGAPIVLNFLIREPGDKYRLIVDDVIWPKIKTTREDALYEYTVRWMKSFEKMIHQYPGQWAWMHNRWKTQPKSVPEGVLLHESDRAAASGKFHEHRAVQGIMTG